MTDNLQLTHLVEACRWIGAKGWAPATGGNMSVRQDEHLCWLSESGKDKGSLTTADFLQVEIATNRAPSGRKPSAETGLHTLIYRLFPEANAVLHVHTVNATVLSRLVNEAELKITGFEMQNPFPGRPRTRIRWPSRCLITTRTSTPSPRASPITRRHARLIMVFFCAAMA